MPSLTANESDILRNRLDFLRGYGALDAKRPAAWDVYGYPAEVTFEMLRAAYERGGAGHGAVHRILDKCWQAKPRIKQPEADKPTAWETKLGKLLKSVNAWQKLRDFDRRNMVGRYSALIYRMADGMLLSQPLVKASKLVDLVPLYEDQIKVTKWHEDQTDADNFGKPAMFQYRTRPPTNADTQAKPETWIDVHPSRLQMLAEGSVGDFFDGVPLLRAGFNALVDIEKISGGSAESVLKNSARTVTINFDKDASPEAVRLNADGTTSTRPLREVITEQVDNLNRNTDSALVTQGATASTLQTTASNPGPSFDVAANLFAASVMIPMTIIFGAQTGRLASDEDQADMVARCASRQQSELTPMLEEFVRRMQAAGVVDEVEFEVEWEPLDTPGDDEKAGVLGKMTAAMQQAFASGITEPIFDANELRGVMGYEPRADDGMPEEGDPATDQNADPAADPVA